MPFSTNPASRFPDELLGDVDASESAEEDALDSGALEEVLVDEELLALVVDGVDDAEEMATLVAEGDLLELDPPLHAASGRASRESAAMAVVRFMA